ncbi:class I SAM-dependent methyltransferase [Oscillatoriales cyanobacterium LEGE 11467]|uniref:Class I SAM-dependent methyltransferase n=1 Tax=Zarconia navalis LEGE 11467 TaxID=1828826 RepID=A0A928Z995_9CYAN|nr:class I SAM-dependent methyltransferase [Zarconia navalis]MBE9040556.1 class I SAM-dependent methyltransferase [Zarconia navalis LEGE 11467]
MRFYSQVLFPRLLDWAMSDPVLDRYRQDILAEVEGEILEIGFGTGLNLPHYPPHVFKITTIDANPGTSSLAQKQIQASSIEVENHILNGESLPMADNTFDSVVSTWTLCSITRVDRAIEEIHRVLKPKGRFFFLEHGTSDDANIRVWQNRLTPLQKIVADGCHLNRNIQLLVEHQFEVIRLERFYMEKLPKVMGYTYLGVAISR